MVAIRKPNCGRDGSARVKDARQKTRTPTALTDYWLPPGRDVTAASKQRQSEDEQPTKRQSGQRDPTYRKNKLLGALGAGRNLFRRFPLSSNQDARAAPYPTRFSIGWLLGKTSHSPWTGLFITHHTICHSLTGRSMVPNLFAATHDFSEQEERIGI
jgi:hypothetical protein